MKQIRLVLASITSLAMMTDPSWAVLPETVSRAKVAARHCSVEWDGFTALEPDAWAHFGPIEIDPEMTNATTDAWNRYTTAVLALQDAFVSILNLPTEQYQNPANFKLTQAKYDLLMCLLPTEAERNLIVVSAQLESDKSEVEIRSMLFEAIDQFLCMRADMAAEKIFRLDPTDETFSSQFTTIITSTMRQCD